MAAEWYYDVDGQTGGPITTGQLKQMAAGGKLLPKHKVKRGTDAKWFSAERVQGLFTKPAGASSANTPPPPPSAVPVAEAVEDDSEAIFGVLPPVPPSEQGGHTFAFFSQFTGTPAAAAPAPAREEPNPAAFDFFGTAAAPPPPPKSPPTPAKSPPAAKPVAKASPSKSPPPPPPSTADETTEDPFGLGALEGPPVAPPPPPAAPATAPTKPAKAVAKSSKPAAGSPPTVPMNIFEDDPFAGLGGMPAPAVAAQSHHNENPFSAFPVTTSLPKPKEGKETKSANKTAKETKNGPEAEESAVLPPEPKAASDNPFGFVAPTDVPAPMNAPDSFISGTPALPVDHSKIEQLWVGRVVRVLPDGRPFVESSPAELVLRDAWLQWKAVEIGGRERLVCLKRAAIEMVSLDTSPDGVSAVILQASSTTLGFAPNDAGDAAHILAVLTC